MDSRRPRTPLGAANPALFPPQTAVIATEPTHPSNPPDLAALVGRARAGDERAMEEIIRAFEARVLRLARHMLGDWAEAEDVAQEVFLQAFRRLDRLDPARNPAGWIVRVTVHACWDRLRERGRRSEATLAPAELESTLQGPYAAAEQSQQREFLRRSLLLLTPRERAVFILHDVDGEEVAAIAGALRIHRITVRRHLSRARERLRAHLAEMFTQDA